MNYLEVLKITIDKNGENIPHLKIAELVLVHVILQTIVINQIQES